MQNQLYKDNDMKKGFPIRLTIDEAIEVFSKPDIKPFSKDKLRHSSFNEIKTFKDAVRTLGLNLDWVSNIISEIEIVSKATAAMFKLNIVKKALNLGQNLHLIKSTTEDSLVYCPKNPFIAKGSTYYKNDIEWCRMEIIGRFNNDGIEYFVLNGDPGISGHSGLAVYDGLICVAHARTEFAFLGCASAEIAEHFGKYFGMLITEAKYGDVDDFTITNDKYGNA